MPARRDLGACEEIAGMAGPWVWHRVRLLDLAASIPSTPEARAERSRSGGPTAHDRRSAVRG
jgi:hypothetical protein